MLKKQLCSVVMLREFSDCRGDYNERYLEVTAGFTGLLQGLASCFYLLVGIQMQDINTVVMHPSLSNFRCDEFEGA